MGVIGRECLRTIEKSRRGLHVVGVHGLVLNLRSKCTRGRERGAPWYQIAAGRGVVGLAYAAAVQSEMIDTSLTGEVRGAGVGKVFAWTVNERRVVVPRGCTWCCTWWM